MTRPRPCLGCGVIISSGSRCFDCRRDRDSLRGTSGQRGYGSPIWRRVRAEHLRAEPSCRFCGAIATDVDHIRPLSQGGTHDAANLRSLCHSCHSRRTLADTRLMAQGIVPSVSSAPEGQAKTAYNAAASMFVLTDEDERSWND